MGGVDFLDVAHQRDIRMLVGVKISLRIWRQDVENFAVGRDLARIFFQIGLHPFRDIVGLAVFPGAEPQDDEMQFVFARAVHKLIDGREIKFARLGF